MSDRQFIGNFGGRSEFKTEAITWSNDEIAIYQKDDGGKENSVSLDNKQIGLLVALALSRLQEKKE